MTIEKLEGKEVLPVELKSMKKGINSSAQAENSSNITDNREVILKERSKTAKQVMTVMLNTIESAKINAICTYECEPEYISDYVIIGTGTSDRHVEGSAEKIIKELKQNCKLIPKVDKKNKEWIVIDGDFVIIHLMTNNLRSKYTLDTLMKDDFSFKLI